MKKIWVLFTLFVFLSLTGAFGADRVLYDPAQSPDVPFRLYQTGISSTYLKLDTRDGRIWRVQYVTGISLGVSRGTVVVSNQSLVDSKQPAPGRFTLYPTSDIFTFILVDQIDGRTWQVQWGMNINDGKGELLPIP